MDTVVGTIIMDTVVGTILIAVILIAIVAAIIYKLVKDKKQGKSSCGGSCGCCPNSSRCHRS